MTPPPANTRRFVVQGVFARPGSTVQARGAGQTAIQRRPGMDAFRVNLTPKAGGWPLPRDVQAKMESALGANFSDVRIHVGPEATAIGAIAFTWGSDIHFAPGQYNPHTPHGQSLLGHELTHVVQQRAGRVSNPFGSGVAVVQDHALEAEADRLGRQAAMSRTPEAGANRSSFLNGATPKSLGGAVIHRKTGPAFGASKYPRVGARQAVNPTSRSRTAQMVPSRTVQRFTLTQTLAEANMFDLNTQLTVLDHQRVANTTAPPLAQNDLTANDRTVRHCIPYNYIRDQLRTMCMRQPNRHQVLARLNGIATDLNVPTENPAFINSRALFDGAVDRLFGRIGNWSGNLFVCDNSTLDVGGRNRDNPPRTFTGYQSLMDNVQTLQWIMDTKMAGVQVARQHLQGNVTQTGARDNAIDVEMLFDKGLL